MLFTPEEIVSDVKLLQSSNADLPMLVTLDGIVTDVKPLHFLNAYSPILVTPDGIVTAPPAPVYFVNTPSLMTKSDAAPCVTVIVFVTGYDVPEPAVTVIVPEREEEDVFAATV